MNQKDYRAFAGIIRERVRFIENHPKQYASIVMAQLKITAKNLSDYIEKEIKCSCGNKAEYICECGELLCGNDPCSKGCGGAVNPFREQFLKWCGVQK